MINSELSNRQLKVPDGTTYENILDILGMNQETVLLLNEKKAVPVDGIAVPGNLTIMCIASQG
jgi:sulfur carrier protein